jgi:hypothetical protein
MKKTSLVLSSVLLVFLFAGASTLWLEGREAGRPLSASLSGAEEVPGPGDLDGSGMAMVWLNPGRGEICFTLAVSNIDPATGAHIHIGEAGVAGPVVVPLVPPTTGTSSGCISVDRDLIRDIIRNPGNYYVNVHNPAFPAGAVRGQLSK